MKPKMAVGEERPHRGRENHAGSSTWDDSQGRGWDRWCPAPGPAPLPSSAGAREQVTGDGMQQHTLDFRALLACHPLFCYLKVPQETSSKWMIRNGALKKSPR